jgi:hypothetical protein
LSRLFCHIRKERNYLKASTSGGKSCVSDNSQ